MSLVDQINILIISVFRRSQPEERLFRLSIWGVTTKSASLAAKQLLWVCTLITVIIAAVCILSTIASSVLLRAVEADVMSSAEIYFYLTALLFPPSVYITHAPALFRSMGNSRITLVISLLMNLINIGGNTFIDLRFSMGVPEPHWLR